MVAIFCMNPDADVMLNCISGQIQSETNTKEINLRGAFHFHFEKRQKEHFLLISVVIAITAFEIYSCKFTGYLILICSFSLW